MNSKVSVLFVVFIIWFLPSVGQVNLSNGLVGYFPFDGNSNDVSSIQINGVVNNATLTQGKNNNINGAYFFNGANAYIDCSINNRSITNTVVISAWVKTTSSNYNWVVGKYDWTIDRGFHLFVSNGHPVLAGRNGSGFYTTTNYPNPSNLVNDGNWHHLLGIIDDNTWSLYVDCILDNQVISTSSFPDLTNSLPLTIGNYIALNGSTLFFNGSIDDVRIYNRVLTPAEIQTLCDINFIGIQAPVVSNDTTVCIDTLYTISAIPDTGTIVWESPLGNQVGTGNTYTTSSNQNQTFYVYSVLNGNISDTSQIQITVQNCGLFNSPIVSNDTLVCKDSIFTMTALADSGLIQWESPLGTSIGTGNSLTASFNQNTTVYVYSISNGNISDTSQIQVTVQNCSVFNAPIVSNDTLVCKDSTFTMTALADSGLIQWESPLGTSIGTGNSLTTSFNQNTTVYVYSISNGNISDTSQIQITVQNCSVFNAPIVSNDTLVCKDSIFTMTALADSGLIQWESPLGANIGTGNSLTRSFNQNTTVYVYSNSNGNISDTSQIQVATELCEEIIFPNIFTPNADGVNDYFVFKIPNYDCFRCDVFNRWGVLIFSFTNPDIGWDGYLPEQGIKAQNGVYFYMLDYCLGNKSYQYQGTVTISR